VILGIESKACLPNVSSKITAGSQRCLALEERAVIGDAELTGRHASGYQVLQANSFHCPSWQSRGAQRFSSRRADGELSCYDAQEMAQLHVGSLLEVSHQERSLFCHWPATATLRVWSSSFSPGAGEPQQTGGREDGSVTHRHVQGR